MAKVNRVLDYSESQIRTAGKLKSLQMLHEGASRYIRATLEDKDKRHENVIKAQNVLAQLQMALRVDESDYAALLFYLYDYIYNLVDAGDDNSLQNAAQLLDHLSMTFRLVGKRGGSGQE